jgi:hypothetical protein
MIAVSTFTSNTRSFPMQRIMIFVLLFFVSSFLTVTVTGVEPTKNSTNVNESEELADVYQFILPEEQGIKDVCFIPIPGIDEDFLCGEDIITVFPAAILKIPGKFLFKTATKDFVKVFNWKFSRAVINKCRDGKDPFHCIPDEMVSKILKTKPEINLKDGFKKYILQGEMKGKTKVYKGRYEIGVSKDGIIEHSFFRPDK